MGLEVVNLLSELDDFISAGRSIVILVGLNFVKLICYGFKIFDHAVKSVFLFEIGLINKADIDFSVVTNCFSQSFKIGIDEVWKLVDSIVKNLEVGKHGLLDSFLNLFDFIHSSRFIGFQEFVELGSVDRKMSLNDLKAFINIFLHIFVINQVLLELLSQLDRKSVV